jgi:hypothetical protein
MELEQLAVIGGAQIAETERSLERIGEADLRRLGELAADAEMGLFARHPDGAGRYAGRLLSRALCQGAARHFVDGRNGVRTSTSGRSTRPLATDPFPYRWRGTADFGPSRFGRWPGDPPSYAGRRVDFLGRSLPVPPDAATALRDYLSSARTASAKALARKAVILIIPEYRAGECVWSPHGGGQRAASITASRTAVRRASMESREPLAGGADRAVLRVRVRHLLCGNWI